MPSTATHVVPAGAHDTDWIGVPFEPMGRIDCVWTAETPSGPTTTSSNPEQ
jgi:hypothetical protein